MPFNEKALRRVQQCILAEPSQFDMTDFQNANENSSCGTTACIAGWLVWNERKDLRTKNNLIDDYPIFEGFERLAIQIVDTEYLDISCLFYVNSWPITHKTRFRIAKTPEQRAKIASEVIDDFIESEKYLIELEKTKEKIEQRWHRTNSW